MSQPTHRIRPRTAEAWELVDETQLAQMRAVFGPFTFEQGYTVEALAEKPEPLPLASQQERDYPSSDEADD